MGINVATPAPVPTRSRRQISIDRALAKAHEQARAGNLPTLLRSQHADGGWRQVWAVGSRTTAGSVYTIDLCHDHDGIATLCGGAAAEAERVCWHRAAARLAHLGELAWHDPITGRTISALTADAATATLAHFVSAPTRPSRLTGRWRWPDGQAQDRHHRRRPLLADEPDGRRSCRPSPPLALCPDGPPGSGPAAGRRPRPCVRDGLATVMLYTDDCSMLAWALRALEREGPADTGGDNDRLAPMLRAYAATFDALAAATHAAEDLPAQRMHENVLRTTRDGFPWSALADQSLIASCQPGGKRPTAGKGATDGDC